MSKWYVQLTYDCGHEIDPWGGTCGGRSRFVLMHNASIDMTTIFHKSHIDDHGSRWVIYSPGIYINDIEIKALTDLLNMGPEDNKEKIDPTLWPEIKNLMG